MREKGVLRAVVSTEDLSPESLVAKAQAAPDISMRNLVQEVSCSEPFEWTDGSPAEWGLGEPSRRPEPKRRVAVLDCGVKRSILCRLVDAGCRVTVLPWNTPARDVLALRPDGILVSNGPGDPASVPDLVETVRELVGRRPSWASALATRCWAGPSAPAPTSCALAITGNQPVRDCAGGRVCITAQNHNYAIDPATLDEAEVEVTEINLNDRTVEGLRHRRWPLFGVQYHPEAGPGPHDAVALFTRMMDEWK